MKILIATETYTPTINGVVTSTRTLKQALEQAGHEVYILTLGTCDAEDEVNHVYRVHSFGLGKLYPDARFSFSKNSPLVNHLMNWQPDIIHTQGEFSTFLMAQKIAKVLNIPMVHTYHTVYEDYTHYFSPNKLIGKKIVRILSRKILHPVEEVIAPTQKVKYLLEEYQVKAPVTVIPTGLSLAQFETPLPEERKQEMRTQLEIQPGDFVMLSLGRVAKEKNIEELVHFVSEIDELPLKLIIVGDGPHRPELEELVAELGIGEKVYFVGMVAPEEVAAYYQVADLFVSASTSETQGLTYIEALASGLPALCRYDESIAGVIEDGRDGYQYHDFEEFKHYLEQLVHDESLRQELGKQARKFALENYSDTNFAQKVLTVYERAIASHVESVDFYPGV